LVVKPTVGRAVKDGVGAALRNYPAAVWTYVLLTLASLPIALAAGVFVHGHLASSERADDFARGLDALGWLEILRQDAAVQPVVIVVMAGLFVSWIVASTYLAGATIGAVSRAGEPTKTSDFFAGGGRSFGRLMRLLTFTVPFFALAVVLPAWGAGALVERLTREMVSEKAVLAVRALAVVLGLVLFAWASSAHDFMRVEAVARGEHRARYAFWRGLQRAVRHPFGAASLSAVFGGSALLLTLVASLADVRLDRASWLTVLGGVVLQQGVVLARAALRVALAGAEVAFSRSAG
jgi:hypothetical protein